MLNSHACQFMSIRYTPFVVVLSRLCPVSILVARVVGERMYKAQPMAARTKFCHQKRVRHVQEPWLEAMQTHFSLDLFHCRVDFNN